jgi:hypothetical protein
MKLLFKWPSRQRFPLVVKTMGIHQDMFSGKHDCRFLLSLDSDDKGEGGMNTPEARKFLDGVPGVEYVYGVSKGKVDAYNRDLDRLGDFDIIAIISEDLLPVVKGFDDIIATDMQRYWPDLDGVLWYPDGMHGRDKLMTYPIMGRVYYQRDGIPYRPDYRCWFCDDHLQAVAQARGKLKFLNKRLIEHPWTAYTGDDALRRRNNKKNDWRHDQRLFESFKQNGFPELIADQATVAVKLGGSVAGGVYRGEIQPLLSILTPTLPGRFLLLKRLQDVLQPQLNAYPGMVEWLTDDSRPPVTIGEKRQALLEKAKGKYVVSLDDDDLAAVDYVQRLLQAFASDQDAYGYNGDAWKNGVFDRPFVTSFDNQQWVNKPGMYLRPIYHYSPVRRELALKAGFKPLSFGEDVKFSEALKPLIKTAGFVDGPALVHYLYHEAASTCNNLDNNAKVFDMLDVARMTPDFNAATTLQAAANPPDFVHIPVYACNDRPLRNTPW